MATKKTERPGKQSGGAKSEGLLDVLRARFEKNLHRHSQVSWAAVEQRLAGAKDKLRALAQMEETGGEPDVIGVDPKSGEFLFVDCAAESPKGRRSVCYDEEARLGRKEAPPKASALGLAKAMGLELLDEGRYAALQALGEVDTKTSSWLATPVEVRKRGGALFGDCRYARVFTYHNGAESYYAARGFRGLLRV